MSHASSRTPESPPQGEGGLARWRSVAENIVANCLRIVPGEVVQLGGGVHNFDFVGALAAAVRRRGAYPELNVTSDDMQLEMLLTVPEEHLRTAPPHRLRWLEDVDAMIVTDSVADPTRAEAVPRERRIAAHAAAQAVERRLFELGLRWAYVGFPTPANASGYPIPFEELQQRFWEAVDIDYETLAVEGAALAAKLERADLVRIVTPSGTDLVFRIQGRPVLVDDGVISDEDIEEGNAAVHLPAGRLLTAPLESSASGTFVADWSWQDSHMFAGLVFEVEDGRVRLVRGDAGMDEFRRRFDNARGDKDRLGAFGIGLNPAVDRFVGYRALDEKRRGAVHLSLGDNRLFGGENVSSFHFDLFLDEPTVYLDDELVVEGGRVLVEAHR